MLDFVQLKIVLNIIYLSIGEIKSGREISENGTSHDHKKWNPRKRKTKRVREKFVTLRERENVVAESVWFWEERRWESTSRERKCEEKVRHRKDARDTDETKINKFEREAFSLFLSHMRCLVASLLFLSLPRCIVTLSLFFNVLSIFLSFSFCMSLFIVICTFYLSLIFSLARCLQLRRQVLER